MDRNEELAVILGIEPKEYLRPDDEIYWGSTRETMRDVDIIYPDFSNSNNFLKLLEILFHTVKGFGYLEYENKSLVDTILDGLLTTLIEIKEVLTDKNNQEWNKFKQQVQQVKWEY